jgi:RNA-directed DNA polymerase
VGKSNVAHFDLSNFYPNTSSGRVYKLFCTLGCEHNTARLLSRLTTAQGQLPQGFSTSPKIAGLVLLRAGTRIKGLVEKYKLTPSIWIDDLVLSGDFPIEKLEPMLDKIIQAEGFKFNDKTSFTSKNKRQVATGAVVNKKLGVPKERMREMRRTLHRIKVMGLEAYAKKFHPDFDTLRVKQKISGDLGYMISINRERYEVLQKEWRTLSEKSKATH